MTRRAVDYTAYSRERDVRRGAIRKCPKCGKLGLREVRDPSYVCDWIHRERVIDGCVVTTSDDICRTDFILGDPCALLSD